MARSVLAAFCMLKSRSSAAVTQHSESKAPRKTSLVVDMAPSVLRVEDAQLRFRCPAQRLEDLGQDPLAVAVATACWRHSASTTSLPLLGAVIENLEQELAGHDHGPQRAGASLFVDLAQLGCRCPAQRVKDLDQQRPRARS